jgi:hypothetical protein
LADFATKRNDLADFGGFCNETQRFSGFCNDLADFATKRNDLADFVKVPRKVAARTEQATSRSFRKVLSVDRAGLKEIRWTMP